jgi:hypothetical protein
MYLRVLGVAGVATHPPMLLRMAALIEKLVGAVGITPAEADSPELQRHVQAMASWDRILRALLDAPMKVALPLCHVDMLKGIAETGRLVQILPDLAGVIGVPDDGRVPGYPKDEGALMLQCIPRPASP